MDSVAVVGSGVRFLAHQVFLSYATEDADSARLLCRVLEAEEGIRCWIAPRDVEAGTDYAAAILDAIKSAELVLLLFSSSTNASPYVLREIERAIAYERPVVSVRLDAATPNASLEYYLNLWQWLDAPRGIESKRREIVAAVRKQLDGAGDPSRSEPSQPAASFSPTPPPPQPTPPDTRSSEGERKLVTVLTAGISDFAALSERMDPEALHDLITACFERLIPSVERYGGTVDKSVGEELTAFFGAPRAHENDPERALRAALEMREALDSFNKRRPVPVAVQFGVNTGLVLAGGMGAGKRRDYSVVGETVSVADRLKELAKPGEILVGADTYRQAEHLFAWQPTVRTQVRGKSAPLTVYQLLKAHPAPSAQVGRQTRGVTAPLVGRESELASLSLCLTRLRKGEGAVVFMTGEAGLGKSRLAAEARAQAEQERIPWLEGSALSFGRTISYWPLLEIIQKDAGIESDDPESERWAKLAARVGTLFGEERNEILPYLGTLLSLSLPEEFAPKVRYLDGEAMGRQIYRATRLYFARLAGRRPTVVAFEDVHWLDGSTASLLEHLLPLSGEVPILFLLVSRPETETAGGGLRELLHREHPDRLTEIALKPLSPEESMALLRNLAHLDELPARLRDTILAKTEGNPFFVEEVVRSLVDLGGLVWDDAAGRWRLTEQAARIAIPDTLQGVIMARIDRLDDDLKQVLRLASVVGRSFFYRVLASVAEADRELDQCLTTLEARELILEKARDPELEYIFKHALVQEATYESILLQRRRELHRKVALAIETLFPERLEEFYSLLAYHYSRAEDWEKAQDYLFKAGDQAGSIAADAEALAHYEEAVEAYSKVFGDKWNPLQRAALERKMGEALYRRGDHEHAREYLYQALATLGSPFPDSDGAIRRAMAVEIVRQIWHRLWPWFKPTAIAPDAAQIVEERCRVYQTLGWLEVFTRPFHMMLMSLIQLNVAERADLDWAVSAGSSGLGVIFACTPLRAPARSYIERARRLAEHGGWPAQLAQADWTRCTYELAVRGDFGAAFDYAQRAWERFRGLGDIRFYAGITMGTAIHVPAERGEFRQGLAMAGEMAQAGREAGDHLTEAYGEAWESELLFMTGEMAAGETGMRRTIDVILASTDYRIAQKVAGRLATCLLVQGRLEEAQALLPAHRENVRKYGIRGFNASILITTVAAAALAAAERAEGPAREAARKDARRACRAALKQGRVDTTAFVPAYRWQGTYEWLRGNPHKAEEWWRKSLDHAAKLGARYEGALTMLEMGRRQGGREQLKRAESEFEAMGAQFFLAEARGLLSGQS